MKHARILITSFISFIFLVPFVEACYVINDLGPTSCSIYYQCSCSGEDCSFGFSSAAAFTPNIGDIGPSRFCEIAWITWDGQKPPNFWDKYPNAYGSSFATNSYKSPKPPVNYNGKPCEVRMASCLSHEPCSICFPYTDCWYSVFEGKWDYNERGCIIKCNGNIEKQVHFGIGGDETRNRCESACGASSVCDEVPPGGSVCIGDTKRTCDSNCNFVSDESCGYGYYCSDGVCNRIGGGGGGQYGPWFFIPGLEILVVGFSVYCFIVAIVSEGFVLYIIIKKLTKRISRKRKRR